jgi:hypothetical protein
MAGHAVTVVDSLATPTAVVAAPTTWNEIAVHWLLR